MARVVRVHSKTGRTRKEYPAGTTYSQFNKSIADHFHIQESEVSLAFDDGGRRKLSGQPNDLLSKVITSDMCVIWLMAAQAQTPNTGVQQTYAQVDVAKLPDIEKDDSAPPSPVKEEKKEEEGKEPARSWLCQHPLDQRCLNCPKERTKFVDLDQPEKEDLSWMCNCGPNMTCSYCLKDDFVAGIKHKSYEQWLKDRRQGCQHPAGQWCHKCLPPAEQNYKIKEGCPKHPPYPIGICNSCMPQTCNLNRQPYRHVDYLQLMNVDEVTNFVQFWQSIHHMQQRVGFMYGYYAADPNYPEGVRAVCEAIYEPPQDGDMNGFYLMYDEYDTAVDLIAQALGLTRIGMVFTSINHDLPLTSKEIRQAARWQQDHVVRHPSGSSVSKFVTVTIKPQEDGNCLPEAYMVSDQAQALERDNVFGESDSNKTLVIRQQGENELIPNVLVTGNPKAKIQPEFCIVNVGCGLPTEAQSIIQHYDFPIANRSGFDGPVEITNRHVKEYVARHRNEPTYVRYNCFHFLVHLAKVLDPGTAFAIAESVANQETLDSGVEALINSIQ